MLSALYRDHNGMGTSAKSAAMRLMSLDEALDFYRAVRSFGWNGLGLRAFWTDDNSNYAGLYVAGPLLDKVCFVDHEDYDISPVYRSLTSFLATLLAAIP